MIVGLNMASCHGHPAKQDTITRTVTETCDWSPSRSHPSLFLHFGQWFLKKLYPKWVFMGLDSPMNQ